MLERRKREEAEALINMPSSGELISQLREKDLLISGPGSMVCRNFVELVADRVVTPEGIATAWAQARETVMGERGSVAKFIIGLCGTDVIKALIPEKDLAKEAIDYLSSAYSEVSKQA